MLVKTKIKIFFKVTNAIMAHAIRARDQDFWQWLFDETGDLGSRRYLDPDLGAYLMLDALDRNQNSRVIAVYDRFAESLQRRKPPLKFWRAMLAAGQRGGRTDIIEHAKAMLRQGEGKNANYGQSETGS